MADRRAMRTLVGPTEGTEGGGIVGVLAPWFGVALFVAAASAGYFYNLTFVQLGVPDLGSRVLGLTEDRVALAIALLAGLTLAVAVTTGLVLHRQRWSADFLVKLRMLSLVVVLQTALTAAAPALRSEGALLAWVVVASVCLGAGVPCLFGLTCDLVPVRHRGAVAALVTSVAFLAAAVFSSRWRIEQFAAQLLWLMIPGAVGLVLIAFVPSTLTALLARQHSSVSYGPGRFTYGRQGPRRTALDFALALVLMFGVYFIDSLGFLRIVATGTYLASAWGSPEHWTVWAIGLTHVLGAVLAGILYPALGGRALLGWVFALFALAQLGYVLHALTTADTEPPLGMPLVYAVAVSIYTVLNFALWADFSTPETIALRAAMGVGVAGWLATFASTSLSLWWRTAGVPFEQHLRATAAISLVLLVVTVVLLAVPRGQRRPAGEEPG